MQIFIHTWIMTATDQKHQSWIISVHSVHFVNMPAEQVESGLLFAGVNHYTLLGFAQNFWV